MKTSNRNFSSSRLPVTADEPNLSWVGEGGTPSVNLVRIGGLVAALCLGLMLGLVLGSGTHAVSVLLIGLGGALTLAACAFADWE